MHKTPFFCTFTEEAAQAETAYGLQVPVAGSPNVTSLLGAGAHVQAPQPQAQTLLATPQIRVLQVANQPGLYALIDHSNSLQMLQTAQQNSVQLAASPPNGQPTTQLAMVAGARPQLVVSPAPVHAMAPMQQEFQAYSSVMTTPPQSIQQDAVSLSHQQMQVQGALSTSTMVTLDSVPNAGYSNNSQLTQGSTPVGDNHF